MFGELDVQSWCPNKMFGDVCVWSALNQNLIIIDKQKNICSNPVLEICLIENEVKQNVFSFHQFLIFYHKFDRMWITDEKIGNYR